MQADTGYDTTRFQALRRELGALNQKAIADGLVGVRDGVVMTAATPKRAARKAAAAAKSEAAAVKASKKDRTPAAAAGLLALLHRRDGDESPDVPGTAFTEDGVVRLLGSLRRRTSRGGGSGAWSRFLQQAQRHLSHPVPFGLRTIRGVGVERVQVLARQLEDIESRGWAQFIEAREVRRRKVGPALPLTPDVVEPAKMQRKGKSP